MEAKPLAKLDTLFSPVESFVENTDSFVLSLRPSSSLHSGTASSKQFTHVNSVRSGVNNRDLRYYQVTKRAIDILGAGSILLVASPVMGIVALTVRLTSPGPVIFKQRRLTYGGKEFTMFKFRTMRSDAERVTGPVWAAANDPRITKLGKFLRATRLDELPQLLNVLWGDMSLIGPRPERPEFTKELEQQLPRFRKRLEVKAGLTGLAQVTNGYAATMSSYRKKLAFDLVYIKKQSLLLDLAIAAKTALVVFTGKGAR